MASSSNTLRDIALSISAASLVTVAILFGVTQCSGDKKSEKVVDKKTPKIEVVNNNKVVANGNANVKSNSRVVVGDAIVVENNNEVVVEKDCGCNKDTLVVEVVKEQPKPVQKKKPVQPKPAPVVHDTVYVPVQPVVKQDTIKPKYTISAVHICVRNNALCK